MDSAISRTRLQALGNKLTNEADTDSASKALREFQDDLEQLLEENLKSLNQFQRFIAFFWTRFIEDLFYNLSGDFPYRKELKEPFDAAWLDILKTTGDSILKIAKQIDGEDCEICFEACTSVVSLYLEKVDELNRLIGNPA